MYIYFIRTQSPLHLMDLFLHFYSIYIYTIVLIGPCYIYYNVFFYVYLRFCSEIQFYILCFAVMNLSADVCDVESVCVNFFNAAIDRQILLWMIQIAFGKRSKCLGKCFFENEQAKIEVFFGNFTYLKVDCMN